MGEVVVQKSFQAPRETYEVVVVTSDENNAGTTDDVFITMHGEWGDSGELPLSQSKTNVLKFSRGQVRSRSAHNHTSARGVGRYRARIEWAHRTRARCLHVMAWHGHG